MMETQVLIQEIQKKHQITLKPDDPVFVTVTLNDLLLSHYLEKFHALLEAQNRLVVSEGIERLNQASAIGSEMVNRSLDALSQTLEEKISQIADQIIVTIEQRKQQQTQEAEQTNARAHWGVYLVIALISLILGVLLKSYFP